MKIKINLDDPEDRAIWEAAKQAGREVDGWPAWKRGEDMVIRNGMMRPCCNRIGCRCVPKRPWKPCLKPDTSILDLLEQLRKPVPCKQHPKYKGKSRPRLACEACWRIWILLNPAKLYESKRR